MNEGGMMRHLLALTLVVAAACSAPPPQNIVAAPTSAAATPTPTPTPEPTPTEAPPTLAPDPTPEPEPTPVPLGVRAAVASEWTVAVGKPNFNAWKVVYAANSFNTKPPTGMVDVLIPIKATYTGAGRTTFSVGTWTAVLGLGTATERQSFEDPTCGVIPNDIEFPDPTVRTGGKVSGNICYVVDKSDVSTLVLLWYGEEFGYANTESIVTFALR